MKDGFLEPITLQSLGKRNRGRDVCANLTASLKLLKCNNYTFCFFSLVSGVTYTCWPLRQQGRNKGSLASKKKGDAVRWLARQRCCRRGRRVAARSDGSIVAPLGVQIDGFPNANLRS